MFNIWSSNPAFREIFTHTPHAMWLFEEGTLSILAANPAAVALYGYSEKALCALTIRDLLAKDDLPRFEECLAAMSSSERHSGRCRHVTNDGRIVHVDMTWYRIGFDAHSANMVLAIDVTAQVLAEQRAQQHVRELEHALDSTIDMIRTITELRDAYTAGHAGRVGQFAAALGRELALPQDTCRGLRVMGMLHDIGKIGIPVELLTKPKPLTAEEYALVKTHVELGHDIVRRFVFPWPVADAVAQHHERLDGSGYPYGLKAAEIRLESHIVLVADVIDAMNSHRPYRAKVERQRIRNEFVSGAGALYHLDVAHAAVRLMDRQAFPS